LRTHISKPFSLTPDTKKKLLTWAQPNSVFTWLDSNAYPSKKFQTYDALLAIGAHTQLSIDYTQAFNKLKVYKDNCKDWLIGYLGYDLKNDVEALTSTNFDGLHFPDLYFFQPQKLLLFSKNEITFCYLPSVVHEIEDDWETINAFNGTKIDSTYPPTNIKIKLRTSKDSYFEKVEKLLHHIERGDIYEANFCQEFYAENVTLDALRTYFHLNEISRPPFAAFIKLNHLFALSASPERYIKRDGNQVVSQPIKGTAKRLNENKKADQEMAQQLSLDPKERSENIMITDLVRNDLSRFARKGSVVVDELCKVYTFEQVHQLISTISCKVPEQYSSVDILKQTFPMGSMTGAPKISAMKIIEELEDTKRSLYSGAIGYFDPKGNFDFNVVIRSIFYNAFQNYVSYSVGGAITANSIPEKEYEECLLKAKAMREALEN